MLWELIVGILCLMIFAFAMGAMFFTRKKVVQ